MGFYQNAVNSALRDAGIFYSLRKTKESTKKIEEELGELKKKVGGRPELTGTQPEQPQINIANEQPKSPQIDISNEQPKAALDMSDEEISKILDDNPEIRAEAAQDLANSNVYKEHTVQQVAASMEARWPGSIWNKDVNGNPANEGYRKSLISHIRKVANQIRQGEEMIDRRNVVQEDPRNGK